MKTFLQRLGGLVLGILSGLDRLILRGKLCPLYAPEGMNIYLGVNHVLRKDFERHADQVTRQVARGFAAKHRVQEGLVCVLQCVEPCGSYETNTKMVEGAKTLVVQGKQRQCSFLYHYFIDRQFGWMFVRLQTWFPFEIEVYVHGREWLSRTMDKEKLRYRRGDNKMVWVEDWQRAQQLLDEQLQTHWPTVLDAWQHQVHPLHPGHLGQLPLAYNWTVHQSEWASDVAFASRGELVIFARCRTESRREQRGVRVESC